MDKSTSTIELTMPVHEKLIMRNYKSNLTLGFAEFHNTVGI